MLDAVGARESSTPQHDHIVVNLAITLAQFLPLRAPWYVLYLVTISAILIAIEGDIKEGGQEGGPTSAKKGGTSGVRSSQRSVAFARTKCIDT